MKKQLIALSLAASLVAMSTPALAAPRPKPPRMSTTTTVLVPLTCGPNKLFVRWTGSDPTSIALKYNDVDTDEVVFNFALTSDQLAMNELLADLYMTERATMRSISLVDGKSSGWTWVAATSGGPVTSVLITCDAKDPLVEIH